MAHSQEVIEKLMAAADIRPNGKRPWDPQIHDQRFYKRVLKNQNLGLGESYMDGWWDCSRIDELINHILSADLQTQIKASPKLILIAAKSILFNRQGSVKRSKKNASHHYNIGNDLYESMLGQRTIYSCAYWKNAKTLDQAQEAKLELICQKLHLKKGMTVLDIGCGWGGFANYAASKYGVKVTGISPASEQVKLAKQRTRGQSVKILQRDYRDITGKFDRIVSIGMLEHVGNKNYQTFFDKCRELLNDDGLMLHHTIGHNKSIKNTDAWIDKYIFPGGLIPSITQISKAIEDKLIIEDLQNIGPDYDKTLMAWHKNFTTHYKEIQDNYDERFYRMWTYYLLTCAGAFRSRNLQLWQIVMRKIEPSQTYQAIR